MATTTATVKDPATFPPGTTVKAFKRSNWLQSELPPTADKGSADATVVAGSDGAIDFTGLTAAVRYYATATVGGQYRVIGFTVGTEAELDPHAFIPFSAIDTDPTFANAADDTVPSTSAVDTALAGISGGAGALEQYTVPSGSSIGATSLTLDRAVSPILTNQGYVAIDPFTVNCELRRPTISGSTLTVTALEHAHSADVKVIFFQEASVPAWWFGAKGDAATDDWAALQVGIVQVKSLALWLDGGSQGRIYMTSLPLCLTGAPRLRNINIQPSGQFPAEQTNAVLQIGDGPFTFTVDTATNVITASGTTNAAAKPVMFFGSSLPAPLVQGRAYWPTAVTSTTFTVAATKGGATIDITTAGSGTLTVYRGLFGGDKCHMERVTITCPARTVTCDSATDTFTTNDALSHRLTTGQPVYIEGTVVPAPLDDKVTYYAISTGTSTFKVATSEANALANTPIDITTNGTTVKMFNGYQNGAFLNIQQPSKIDTVRIEDCRGIGLLRSGQDGVYINVQVIDCGVGVGDDDVEFNKWVEFDVEGSYVSHQVVYTSDSGVLPSPMHNSGGSQNNSYFGCHHEKSGAINGVALFDFRGDMIQNVYHDVRVTAGPNTVYKSNPETVGKNGYVVRNLTLASQVGTTVAFDDTGDGYHYTYTPQAGTEYFEEHAAIRRPGTTSINDQERNVRLGYNGRYIKESIGNHVSITREFQPASNQTVDQHLWRDLSGNRASGVGKGGRFFTQVNAAPADGDILANQVFWWFDPTNGTPVINFKGKTADGTVFTHSVRVPATAAETTTGTDAVKVVTPSGLAHSDYGKRIIQIAVTDPNGSALTTGDGKAYVRINGALNGYNLVGAMAHVTTVSSSGIPTIQIANVTDSVDMLSTKLTIDANEKDSTTAATPVVIDTTKDDVATADELRIDVDVAGTGTKGLIVELVFQAP